MATAAQPSDEEVIQLAERLQEKFLQASSSDGEQVDERDLSRIRSDLYYVSKFIRHNRGNIDNAYNHMVECHKWRKSFGINDIKYEDIDENLWKTGMAWNQGFDVDGNNVVILNLAMHKKDSKKALMLQKWISFCFEMHTRVFPRNKMCMVFDATGAGLSNMDMELIRFIVNCFKIYFPNHLSWLLVYNMPWVLQAAWKIVQGWLSEGAINKVKFVSRENFQNYIPPDELLTKFGGNNTWQFDYETERDVMLSYVKKVLDEDASEVSEGGAVSGGGKHVRFSSGLPPTRQSRFGADNEGTDLQTASLDRRMLQKGSAAGNGFRRRQVSRLMSLQSPPKGAQESGMIEGVGNGSLPALRRQSEPVSSTSVTTIGNIMLSPSTELLFSGKDEDDVLCTLTLTNITDSTVAYKIKTTAPLRYKVRPNLAIIDGKSVAKVHVMLSGSSNADVAQDKFLVQTYTFSAQESVPSFSELAAYWKSLPSNSIKEHRMRCRWVTYDVSARASTSEPASKAEPSSNAPPVLKHVQALSGNTTNQNSLDRKIETLINSNAELSQRLNRVQRTNYISITLLLILVLVYFF